MAPRTRASQQHHASGSDSDSDAPEAVSLSQSKKQIQQLDAHRKNAELAERESKRALNREKDRKLKERAEKNREAAAPAMAGGKGKGKAEEEVDDLEARMERAMAEANEESGEEESDDEQEYEEFGGIKLGDQQSGSGEDDSEDNGDSSSEDDSEDEDDSNEEDVLPPKSTKIKFNPEHLPEELFAAAFAPQPKRKPEAELEAERTNPPAKKRKASGTKDIVVGSRAIRTLPNSNQPSIPATLPSKKIEKFLDRTLALTAGKQPGKGWERRPANIGVLRRDGPARNFVRGS
ncbi:hypothetical protein HYPSUDRAFT_204664 [Hypholoma sublateritium FD-334 SS-4]|uniref:Uncharacterized protein n=1 Tax=Hypholoma sublateritium (strain FD-334 SS-4) TaxID=945553 RepID=A0A0D2M7Q6_HYPSF|nr:hypothetical protein HYPSUDRAFT_204664 [Hypholoma sublateritium FD-334 SS-4]